MQIELYPLRFLKIVIFLYKKNPSFVFSSYIWKILKIQYVQSKSASFFWFLFSIFNLFQSSILYYIYKETNTKFETSIMKCFLDLIPLRTILKFSSWKIDSSWHLRIFFFFELRILSVKEAKYIHLNVQCD